MNSGGRRLRLIDRLGPPVIPPGQPRPLTLSERISPRTVRSKVFKKRSLRRRAQKLNLDGVRQGPVSASGSSSYCDRRVAIRSPEISPPSSKEIIYSAASAPSSFLRMGEACNIPSLLVVQLAALRSTIVESKFFIPQGALSQGGLRSCIDSPQVTVDLYCLPTILCNCAALSSLSGKKLSATLDTFRAQTTWPRDGTLFIDLNDDAGGKSWLPWELEPCWPLDITDYVRPGVNTVRFIQLEGMAHLTFVVSATRRTASTINRLPHNTFRFGATAVHTQLLDFTPATVTIAPNLH